MYDGKTGANTSDHWRIFTISKHLMSNRPIVLDLSKGSMLTFFDAIISSTNGFDYGTLYFKNQQSYQTISLVLSDVDSKLLESGIKDRHISSLYFPNQPGDGKWELYGLDLIDAAGNKLWTWKYQKEWTPEQLAQLKSAGLADPTALDFIVSGSSNPEIDQSAPRFVELSLSRKKIDISDGNSFLEAKAIIQDNSGLNWGYLRFGNSDAAPWENNLVFSFSQYDSLVKEGDHQEQHISLVKVPASSKSGHWTLKSVSLYDKSSHMLDLSQSQIWDAKQQKIIYTWSDDQLKALKEAGIPDPSKLDFVIEGDPTPQADVRTPKLRNIAISENNIDISNGNKQISFSATVEDRRGFKSAYLQYRNKQDPKGPTLSVNLSGWNSLVSGNDFTGLHATNLKIPSSTKTGTWELDNVYISDDWNNAISIQKQYVRTNPDSNEQSYVWTPQQLQQLKEIGIEQPSLLDFSVDGTPNSGTNSEALKFENIQWLEIGAFDGDGLTKIDVSTGEKELGIEVTIKDSGAGLGSGKYYTNRFDEYLEKLYTPFSRGFIGAVEFIGPSNQIARVEIHADHLVSGSLNNGTFLSNIKLDERAQPGIWRLSDYQLYDSVGNRSWLPDSMAINQYDRYRSNISERNQKTTAQAKVLNLDKSSLAIEIVNSNYKNTNDVNAPELLDIRWSNSKVDVSGAKQNVNLEVDIRDIGFGLGQSENYFNTIDGYLKSLAIPLSNQYVGWISLIGPQKQRMIVDLFTSQIVAGDINNATFRASLAIDQDYEAGIWRISDYEIRDIAGNRSRLPDSLKFDQWSEQLYIAEEKDFKTKLQSETLGIKTSNLTFEVINTTKSEINDIDTPTLTGIRLGKAQTNTTNGQIEFSLEIDIQDTGRGLGQYERFITVSDIAKKMYTPIADQYMGSLTFIGPDNQSLTVDLRTDQLVKGSLNSGTFRTTIKLDPNAKAGIWRLSDYEIHDKAGNRLTMPESLRIETYNTKTTSSSEREYKTNLQSRSLGVDIRNLTFEVPASLSTFPFINDYESPQLAGLKFTNVINTKLKIDLPADTNKSAKALAGTIKALEAGTTKSLDTTGTSEVKTLADLTASKPLIEEARKLLDRYTIKDPEATTTRKASDKDAGFIDFTLKTGALKTLTAEIQLASEVKATAYIKVNPNTGEAFDFTYDPITGLGAELLDTNKNALVDTLRIHLQDGARGDADGLVNGEIRDPGVLAEAPRASVYRFYRNGVHFYTTSDAERDAVIQKSYGSSVSYSDLSANPQAKDPITGGWGYRFEGIAYQALDTQGTALYRFFSPSKGYHFVTTSSAEALAVIQNSVGSSYDLSNAQGQKLLDKGWGFQFEGNTYKVSTIAQTGMENPVYRFFNGQKGVHFYSSSMEETKAVIANSLGAQYATDDWVTTTASAIKQNPLTSTPTPVAGGWGYSFEGISWYV